MSGPGLATTAEIADLAAAAHVRGRLGIDTEFMSEGRYRALLCLTQVVVDGDDGGEPQIIVIDALDGADVTPLAPRAGRSGDRDRPARRAPGRGDPAPCLAAPSSTTSSTRRSRPALPAASAQAGYANLLGSILGRRVNKTASYTRWDARPLTDEQLSYAAEDVAHLLELADEIQSSPYATAAGSAGRSRSAGAWSRRPTSAIPTPPGSDCRASISSIRAPAPWRASSAAWRERTASSEDRPVGSVLADPPLVELAKRQPSNLRGLEQIRGIHPSGLRRRGPAILEAIAVGREAAPIPREPSRERSEPGDAPLIALAEALLRARALEAGLAYELIASRSELEAIVGAARRGDREPDVRTLTGMARGAGGSRLARPARTDAARWLSGHSGGSCSANAPPRPARPPAVRTRRPRA